MLRGIAILLGFQLLGEVLVGVLQLSVPGPVVGMVLLFGVLMWRGKTPASLGGAANGVLRYLGLLFVPAGVGVVQYLSELRADLIPIAAAIGISTVLALAATGWLLQWLLRRSPTAGDE